MTDIKIEKRGWILTWNDYTKTVLMRNGKFYKSFLKYYKIKDLKYLRNKEYVTIKQ